MERIEIFESRAKNIFWAIFMIFVGLFFVVVSFSDGVTERSQIFYVGMGILFILGSLLFFWSAFSKTLVAIISDEGIWTQSFDKTVL